MNKKQKEEQEKIEFLNNLINEKRDFSEEQKRLINNFIFNILISNTVMSRYKQSRYGNINQDVSLYDCINYFGNKLREE